MNHQIYQDWLFTDREDRDDLISQGMESPQEHLEGCELCRALSQSWEAVEAQLHEAPQVAPRPGFVRRWEVRMDVERQRMQRRQALVVLGFSVAAAVALFGLLLFLAWPWLQSPGALLWAGLYRLVALVFLAEMAGGTLYTLFQVLNGGLPALGWVLAAGLFTQLGVLWVVSLRMFANPWRVAK